MTHDIVIRGGQLADGTGGALRTADVAIDEGVVTEVGQVSESARRVIEAGGALVTPGFVDVHTHYDGQATWDERLKPSSLHGVTTVVMGNCGVGFAPVHDHDHQRLIELMEGVEDIPGVALDEGLPWNWNSLAEFLDAIDTPHDIDFATQIPHGALRLHVMGERGADCEPATPDDIAAMAALTTEAIQAGYLGLSTSRTLLHRTSTGGYTPSLNASRDELVALAAAVGTAGTGVLQMVGDFVDVDEEFGHLEAMMAASGRPLSFSLLQNPRTPDLWRELLDRLERAAGAGAPIRGQVAPRAIGVMLGLDCSVTPFDRIEAYDAMAAMSAAEKAARLRQPELRRRIVEALDAAPPAYGWHKVFPVDGVPDYEPRVEDSVAAIAERSGLAPGEVALDHAVGDDGGALFYLPFMNYSGGNLDVVAEMLSHPLTVPGLADGGAHVGTICDASFPTFLLTHWGRDRDHGRLPIGELVRQHCHDTAAIVGLRDRGVIAPGYRADINVIDFDNLSVGEPRVMHDLPAGGRRFTQEPTGYLHTLVAGVETYRNGEATGALPGRLVRGATTAP